MKLGFGFSQQRIINMNDELDLLNIDDVDSFAAGSSSASYVLEEGAYDSAKVVGWQIVTATFEGKERKLIKLLWQIKHEDRTYNLRGSGWTISSNEKATFRKEVSKWFNKTNWEEIVDLLVKGGMLVKNEDGKSAKFNLDAFIGKFGKLLLEEKTSKSGSKYNVIKSISPVKTKVDFEYGEVPSFLVKGDDIVAYKLADGVKVHEKEVSTDAEGNIEVATPATPAKPTKEPKKVSGKEFLEGKTEEDDDDTTLPF